jgi:hypothetical protein
MECAYHPDAEAVAHCSKCGRPLCEECSKSPDNLCIDCSILPGKAEIEEIAGVRLVNWNGWINSYVTPNKAFKNSSEWTSSAGIAMNVLIGFINAGIIAFFLFIIGKTPPEAGGSIIGAFSYTTQFMIFLCVWFLMTLVSYSFAMLVGGMGSLKQHFYLLSLPIPLSPLAILVITGVLSILLSVHLSAVILGAIFITLYAINIVISAIHEAHRFGFLQAAVSGIIPVVIIGAVAGLLILVFRR